MSKQKKKPAGAGSESAQGPVVQGNLQASTQTPAVRCAISAGLKRGARGASRYGLRPARLPPRAHITIMEGKPTPQDIDLSTVDHLNVGFHPWLNIRSARWLRFGSAPTYS